MKYLRLVTVASLVCGASALWADPTVASLGSSITISDGNSAGTGWYGNHEDNETEANPYTVKGQDWDLEGMYMNGRQLTLVGGFDFRYGNPFGGHTYTGGDIFIDTNGTPNYTQADNGNSGLGGQTTNSFGYNYVIHFDSSVTSYTVYQLTSSSMLKRATDVSASSPWVYVSGGTALTHTQDVAVTGYGLLDASTYNALTTQGSTKTGLQGYASSSTNNLNPNVAAHTTAGQMDNNHFYLTVNTSFLAGNTDATFHYTMECGNDNLMGKTYLAPEGGSTLLMLAGATLVFGACRRRARTA